jgi:anti-sigma factor RsiW
MTPAAHPHPDELLAFRDTEAGAGGRRRIEEHLAACEACRAQVALLEDVAVALSDWLEEEPPTDGLERLLARIHSATPVTARRNEWLPPVAASLAGVVVGGAVIGLTGAQLLALPFVEQLALFGPARAVSGFGLGAVVFFGIGSLVTLALAPMLILESQPRERWLAAR